jgi:hypothetical protein
MVLPLYLLKVLFIIGRVIMQAIMTESDKHLTRKSWVILVRLPVMKKKHMTTNGWY